MSRPLLYVPPEGGLFLLTTRTLQGRFLLKPDPKINDLAVGVIGRAQRLYEVEIHAGILMSNHHHWLVSVRDAQQLASFMNYVNGNLALKIGRRRDWREKFWGRRYRPTLISEEPEAQIERMHYVLAQGCKEGLVASPKSWPGVTCVHALLAGESLHGHWISETKALHARQSGSKIDSDKLKEPEAIVLSPLPCWAHLGAKDYQSRIRELVEQIEEETAQHHRAENTRPLGRSAILRQDPHRRALNVPNSPAPLFHCASEQAREKLQEAFRIFVAAYREAAHRLKQGGKWVDFPSGCFPPRLPFVPHQQLAPD